MTSFSIEAPAKVNLTLHVVGKRDDGYHLLDSLVVFAGIGDTLEFSPAETLSLEVTGPTASQIPDGENIVLKAARLLAEATGVTKGAAIRLTKRLPVAAGIGGGSADAAAALKGLMRLWGVAPPAETLRRVALSIGADVPVCLAGTPMRMMGVGEVLEPAPTLPPAWLVLVNPLVPLHTPPVFKARTGPFSAADPLTAPPRDAKGLAEALAARRNDLTPPAITIEPVVGEVLAAIAATADCLLPRMSGSGATCFGLYAEEAQARAAAAQLGAAHPAWWIAPAQLLS
ncbi:4-(cytidine 5'-diphospho)-2-C-methyl-D-erythritol kinase [Paramagnetospirillum magneticum]|uniref:4-diphosphocytidyl-2-C-methyl-D-erythritol kinase n=1 Tax=Paramagnetospirillum magneticum (strain ATCC 700264 / AMB-1) TaxID=342108 RepID=ISPE_PARM1|nr:4-(cytidine 5'-diphospho)-2-C-methyl-D-erythritol kinase [Paramagnetospirillum magneticum]Q2VYT6.1 RecName: Full=4-diphosphocytidyl-2-C-methyl-D-erythritol kinase; Short=CMK; AltName: Full=4-(cytidine-5'-diphospho)-2-C-methyl-D-erythritol kinase [Paramagnetospirillum magneticum AMB-1]BAE53239.1 4-diphosphocytidyl-2C-methyl-D-erythritol 2-phosphate synthase [Paramagnetospirillum magneticum AMB-1]